MHKFAIISYFDKSITREIRDIQETLSRITSSKGSLEAWAPHITVGSGLVVEDTQTDAFYEKIQGFLKNVPVTALKTKEFSFMDNWSAGTRLGYTPYVVYIKPFDYGALGNAAMFFEEELKPQYPAYYNQPWPYNPHITVAFKDLTKEGFEKAKTYLAGKLFEREIVVNNICLAVGDANDVWTEFKRFNLRTS